MNYHRSVRQRAAVQLLVAALCGCTGGNGRDAGMPEAGQDARADVTLSSTPCEGTGGASLSVLLDLPPGAQPALQDVWIGIQCTNADEAGMHTRQFRVLRADASGGPTRVLGLPPGRYTVLGSAPGGLVGAALPVTLGVGSVLATTSVPLRARPVLVSGSYQLGVGDAGVGDAGRSGLLLRDFAIPASANSTLSVGTATLEIEPRVDGAADVTVRIRAADCSRACARLTVLGFDLRVAANGEPAALLSPPLAAAMGTAGQTLAPGETLASSAITVPGDPRTASFSLALTTLGSVSSVQVADAASAPEGGLDASADR